LPEFEFVHRERVRYRDGDAFGHVNNAVYLTYLEQARNAFLASLGLVRTIEDIAMILARVEIDYRAQLDVDEEVEVAVRCSRIGTKSFDLEYELRTGERVVAEARTVLVGFDYVRNASIPISDAWRAALSGTQPARGPTVPRPA
jgi:acyl-CoA thioester hydrolase